MNADESIYNNSSSTEQEQEETMLTQPDNPEAAHSDIDSMLSRKFGKEVANYFSGSPLNRLGFLRADHNFLSQALRHDSANFLLCNDLQPLVQPGTSPGKGKLQYVKYEDVKPIIGEDPFELSEEELIEAYRSDENRPQMIFLGIDEKAPQGLSYQAKKNVYTGAPYFAVDVTPRESSSSSSSVTDACTTLISRLQSEKGFLFGKGRIMNIEPSDAAVYAEARQLLDWNARNPFCAACGHRTYSVHAGFKRTCPPTDKAAAAAAEADKIHHRPACVTRQSISNLCFPRTDPTVIMAVINAGGDKILLGRQKRWPPHWYSTLAGFVEPAESLEEAVRREVYEEAGVIVGRVIIHSTQPWPYPANLMIGAIGQAVSGGDGEKIDLGNDPELHDAKW